jgi:hypothetical protein
MNYILTVKHTDRGDHKPQEGTNNRRGTTCALNNKTYSEKEKASLMKKQEVWLRINGHLMIPTQLYTTICSRTTYSPKHIDCAKKIAKGKRRRVFL